MSFDYLNIGSKSGIVFDGTHTRGVGMSAMHVSAVGQNASYGWGPSFGRHSQWFGRTYVWFDRLPTGDLRLVRAESGGSLRMSIDLMRNGKLRVKDSSNTTIGLTSAPIVTGAWVRIEWKVDHVSGTIEVRLFNSPNSTTPTSTFTSAAHQAIGSDTDGVQIGRSGTQRFASTFWTDDPAVGWTAYLGPAA
jgi:hypothetical protein